MSNDPSGITKDEVRWSRFKSDLRKRYKKASLAVDFFRYVSKWERKNKRCFGKARNRKRICLLTFVFPIVDNFPPLSVIKCYINCIPTGRNILHPSSERLNSSFNKGDNLGNTVYLNKTKSQMQKKEINRNKLLSEEKRKAVKRKSPKTSEEKKVFFLSKPQNPRIERKPA